MGLSFLEAGPVKKLLSDVCMERCVHMTRVLFFSDIFFFSIQLNFISPG